MGHQVNFFVLPDDLMIIERAIRRVGTIVILPDSTVTPELQRLETVAMTPAEMGRVALRVYVTEERFASWIRFRHVPQQGYYLIERDSPAIEFNRPYFDGRVLRSGRLYFQTGIDYPLDFSQWADRVLRSVRRTLARDATDRFYYYGPHALTWMKTTGATHDRTGTELVAEAS